MKKKKKAVVLGGGGAKGAYQAGIFRALKEVGFEYHIVMGTSVGSLNGACMVMGELELCEEIWKNISVEKILDFAPEQDGKISGLLENGQFPTLELLLEAGALAGAAVREKSLDQSPLREMLTQYLDVEKVYASPIDFGLVTMTFPQLKPCYLYKKDIPKERFIDFLMASSACFPAMKPWEIDGQQYIDGGYCDNLPIQMAVDWGAEEIIAVDLNAVGVKRKLREDWNVRLTIIEPLDDLGFLLTFDSDRAKVNMCRGYFDAMKAFGRMEGRDYAFEKNAFLGEGTAFREFQRDILDRLVPGGRMEAVVEESLLHRIERKLKSDGMARQFFRIEVKENVSIEELERFSEREEEKQICLDDAWVLASAEAAGRIFQISPLECYTKLDFDAALKAALEAVASMNQKSWKDWFSDSFEAFQDSFDLKTFVEDIRRLGNAGEQTLFLMEGLKRLIAKESAFSLKNWKMDEGILQTLLLSFSAQFFQEQLIAAIYCLYYEL